MANEYSIAGHWAGEFEEGSFQQWAEGLRRQLQAPAVSLGLVFMAPRFFPYARQVLEILRVHARAPLLVGCSSQGLIVGGFEVEENAGVVVGLYWLPDAELKACHFTERDVKAATDPAYWRRHSGVEADRTHGWLVFIDPFHLDSEAWLKGWSRAFPARPVVGGLASGEMRDQVTQVYLNGEVFQEGGVGISFGGQVDLASMVSQGCTPIGETWTLTKVEQNIIHEIGNRPAYEVLKETFNQLPAEQQAKARGNVFIGLVVNEYMEEFHRGDFLIRNVIGVDPHSGCIAVWALPRAGQTVQFQRRSAAAATEDMTQLLGRVKKELGGATLYGGCLCSCNGRGQNLFGCRNHDAQLIQQQLGPMGLAGFFCNGEIGPVGASNFLHGFTASLALFARKPAV